jgi:cytochrome c oxidase subunit 2
VNLVPNIFAPVSGHARALYTYSMLVLGITGAIFVVVASLLAYAVVRFRERPGDERVEPPQIYGSDQVEIAWTVIPVLIVIVLALVTTRTIHAVQDAPKPPGAIEVTAIGRQWWWELRYPDLGIVTANELHIPVSDPRNPTPTYLTLLSADVAHSFWVPRLAGKTDLIPNRVNHTWMDPEQPGLYLGQCSEYCGTQHAKMLLRVYVHTREDFAKWVATQKEAPVAEPKAAAGRHVFETTACLNCHAVQGTVGNGRFGPDLTHLMSRETLASGAALNTPENLRTWIRAPERLKPGSLMPAMQLEDRELDDLVAYLVTLR